MDSSSHSDAGGASAASTAPSATTSLTDASLKTAGYAYLVGDATLFIAGMLEKNYGSGFAGLTWAAGGFAAARYGNPKAEKQLALFEHKLGEYLKSQQVAIPEDPSLAELRKQNGLIDRIEDFLYQHPSEALNAAYAIGSVGLIHGGLKKHDPYNVASGALIAAGSLAGLLIKEKKADPQHPPQTATEKLFAWAQEKPLRVSGALYGANNLFTVLGAWNAQRQQPQTKSYLFRYATAASYLFANSMTSLSSKQESARKHPEVPRALAEVSARVILAQPKETQEALLQNIAGYLSSQPGMNMTAAELAGMMHQQLATFAGKEAPAASWQEKIAAAPAVAASPAR